MRAIGLHFGHDASGCVVDQNGVAAFLSKERRSRVKGAIGLSSNDLRELFDGAGDDTLVGLTSTQSMPMFHEADLTLSVDGGRPWPAQAFLDWFPPVHPYRDRVAWQSEFPSLAGVVVDEDFPYLAAANQGFNTSYEAMAGVAGPSPEFAAAIHRDGEIGLDGRVFKARFYAHHYLHAVYAAYAATPDRPAIVVSADGGSGPSFAGGGVFFWTPGQRLQPVTPIDGWLGEFYTQVGVQLGLGLAGAAGKLMGLAPYGRPIYCDPALIGPRGQVTDQYRLSMAEVISRWLARHGIDEGALASWNPHVDFPPVLAADVAASAQLIVEQNMLAVCGAAKAIAARSGFDYEAIVLTGGIALNCPANSVLATAQETPVFVPPAANDEGQSIGAAVMAFFDATGGYPAPAASFTGNVYLGADILESEVFAAAASGGWRRVPPARALDQACALLLADQIVGICSGRSEIGPRALGHRSILANPAWTQTWAAVNRLKRREAWRPLAPAVLLEHSAAYFDRGPAESRYMLFNYRSLTKALPAVTHFDHTARLQHVTPETGLLYRLMSRFAAAGGPPVLLNTSFNGPGTPIVETARDAFEEAARLGLDHILTDFGLFSRSSDRSSPPLRSRRPGWRVLPW